MQSPSLPLNPSARPTDFDLGFFASTDWAFDARNGERDLHPYPARFIPEIPRAALATLRPQRVVLDPFCGAGTTLHEALKSGLEAIGVDLNPVACMISRVRTALWTAQDEALAERYVSDLEASLSRSVAVELGSSQRDIPRLSHWFADDAQELLARAIAHVSSLQGPWKDRVAVAVSGATVRLSRQDSDTRYAAVDKKITYESGKKLLVNSLKHVIEWLQANKLPGEGPNAKVYCADTRDLGFLPDESVDAAIFSPPYPNAYEYWLYHKYRMYWLGFDPIKVRSQEIGARPHYSKPNGQTASDFAREMTQVLVELARVTRPDGGMFVVVGDSQIRGKFVNNGDLLVEVANRTGYDLVAQATRSIRPSSTSFNLAHRQARTGEHILLFRRRS